MKKTITAFLILTSIIVLVKFDSTNTLNNELAGNNDIPRVFSINIDDLEINQVKG